MCEITRDARPEKTPVPTRQQNAFPSVVAIRIALLATTAAAAATTHTALIRERVVIVVIRAERRQTITCTTKIIKMKRLIESKPFPKVNDWQKIR